VLTDSNLNLSARIVKVLSKAHARACFIHKCFLSRDPAFVTCSSTARVGLLLLQCMSPHLKCNISKVESVQRRFAKGLKGLTNLPYAQRLCAVKLES